MSLLCNDRELLDAFRRGNKGAMTAVYREYCRPVFSLLYRGFTFQSQGQNRLYRGLHDPFELECAVQEVFARAFAPKARQRYDGIRPYRNYLFTIARNLVIDGLRSSDRERWGACEEVPSGGADGEPAELELPSQESDPEHAAAEEELRRHVEAFKRDLSPDQHNFFELRFEQGMTREQVMARLSISAYRLNKLERSIKKRFFDQMRRHGYFEGHGLSRAHLSTASVALLVRTGLLVWP